MTAPLVLVTGATGYVGGRLVPRLLEAGVRVRCMARDPARLGDRPWRDRVELVRADALEPDTLEAALHGVDFVYYLIHSLGAGSDAFAERDLEAARNVARAAAAAGVRRIVYLGGLEPQGERVSEHLRSRLATGDRLRESGVPVTELRAGVIVGSGSLSFELVRYLTERVPVMVCPRWVRTRTQPIAIRDVLSYLVEAIEPHVEPRVYEIGGADVLTYRDMFRIYAEERGLTRRIIDVPVLTPRLSSLWVGLVTPLPAGTARPLIAGLDNEVLVRDDAALHTFDVRPMGYREAVRRALERTRADVPETAWHGAYSSGRGSRPPVTVEQAEGLIREVRERIVDAPPPRVFDVCRRIGGAEGWLYAQPLWEVRGLLDRALGGVGLQRGRRSAEDLRVGDAIDFWRVEALEPDRLLLLRAEMRLPGRAWLRMETQPADGDRTRLRVSALFEPRGLAGVAYWYALYLPHRFIFSGMVEEIARRARPA